VSRPATLRIADWGLRIALALASATALTAQTFTYTRGQNVAPAYEGWEEASDGSKYFLFGYMNRNWEEEIDVPVGPDNGFSVGGVDQDSRRTFCRAAIGSSSA